MVAYRELHIHNLTFSFERSKLKCQEASKNKCFYYYDSELFIPVLYLENELAISSSELQHWKNKKALQYFVSDKSVWNCERGGTPSSSSFIRAIS